jgi:hypothetical protein
MTGNVERARAPSERPHGDDLAIAGFKSEMWSRIPNRSPRLDQRDRGRETAYQLQPCFGRYPSYEKCSSPRVTC